MSSKCSMVENYAELMLMALHIHFLPQQQYSRVYHCFWLFTLWFIDEQASFFYFYHKMRYLVLELTVFIFFQNPYANSSNIFSCILQHYHDFLSNVAIFTKVVQAYTQAYSFGGRIKLIICQIRHELSVTYVVTLCR